MANGERVLTDTQLKVVFCESSPTDLCIGYLQRHSQLDYKTQLEQSYLDEPVKV